jgi:hypothetical protein
MGGRESRGRPGSHRVAVSGLGSDVADLEEPSMRSERESHGIDRGAREGRIDGEISVMFSSRFVQ